MSEKFLTSDSKEPGREKRTVESAVEELREAYKTWSELPGDSRDVFSDKWLRNSDYVALYNWIKKNGGVDYFVSLVGGEVLDSFLKKRVPKYTDQLAEKGIRSAYIDWQGLSEESRGTFSPVWLQKNGYGGLYNWIKDNGDFDQFVKKVGGDVEKNFTILRTDGYTFDVAVEKFSQAHAEWKALPENERGRFNITWLQKNGYKKLCVWFQKNGGSQSFADKIGGELKEDFELSRIDKYTLELVKQKISEAHAEWKALPENERGPFNITWLENTKYSGLVAWIRKNGGIEKYLKISGEEIFKDFDASFVSAYTLEIVGGILRQAHAEWKALPEESRIPFSQKYLLQKGLGGMLLWMRKNGGLEHSLESAGRDVAKDFQALKVARYDLDTVVKSIGKAHAEWKALPENERGRFNITWLQKNGYGGLLNWAMQNGGLSVFLEKASEDIQSDFERINTGRTPESASVELREAYEKWLSSSETGDGFNITWLQKNGYNGLYSWMFKNKKTHLVDEVLPGKTKNKTDRRDYSEEKVLLHLKKAYEEWKALPENGREKFNISWIENNGFFVLVNWCRKNGGVEKYIKIIGDEVERDFISVRDYNKNTAVEYFAQAHAEWKVMPEDTRGPFNVSWLQKNGYGPFIAWIRKNDSLDRILSAVEEKVSNDFEVTRVGKYSQELAVNQLRQAHAEWKVMPEDTRGPFNVSWLEKKGYGGLVAWMRKNKGVEYYINLIHPDAKKDFTKQEKKPENVLASIIDSLKSESTPESQMFWNLIRVCGSSRAVDILFQLHPRFKGMPIERVSGMLADYLGEHLAVKQPFTLPDLEAVKEHLKNKDIRAAAYETVKDDCLQYYFREKRLDRNVDSQAVIYKYLDHIVEQIGHVGSRELDDLVQEVILYYDSVLKDFHKPKAFVDSLQSGREFPDINQRVNMKELADKKRLLIADEMGLGKSASVIMAKEQLGAQCALVVVPSNVISTWEGYLSDKPGVGYYKPGLAPRVLRVENIESLRNISPGQYHYILLSQERLRDDYAEVLKGVDFDMLVVDEVHKLKNLQGKRSNHLVDLSKRIQGEDKYLALLSGTPAPNKVRDIVLPFKLLLPDELGDIPDRQLTNMVIRGTISEFRSILLPRMQMKKLEDGVEMPPLTERMIETDLSAIEKDVYEVLLEEDELTALDKMRVLRQFVMNPELVDATPGIEGSKTRDVSRFLQDSFATRDRIVLFVNGYVSGVIRGERSILQKLDLPHHVHVRTIHGEERDNREQIQDEFNAREKGKKILLVVSGQTADVGVKFTGAQMVVFYNEPWNEYDRRQQLGRARRPGQESHLDAITFKTKDTIEEGIHEYIQKKYHAVEKLLRGVPTSELEQRLLLNEEKGDGGLDSGDIEVNPELARYYFSARDILNRMFGHTKNIGEEDFAAFLENFGGRYAEAYTHLGSRSYQANSNRVSGTLVHRFVEERGQKTGDVKILDMASGPEFLKRHLLEEYAHGVTSMDLNQQHFAPQFRWGDPDWEQKEEAGRRVVGSWFEMPFDDESYDYLNMSLAFQYASFNPKKRETERFEVLQEMNRVLKVGGRAVIAVMYSLEAGDKGQFSKVAEKAGFTVVEEYTGEVKSGKIFQSNIFTLEKVRDSQESPQKILEQLGEDVNGLVLKNKDGVHLKDTRKVMSRFSLNGKDFDVSLNGHDKAVLEEEGNIEREGVSLKERYGSILGIPRDEIIQKKFIRILVGKKYILFKKLTKGNGVVLVK